jgi:hypothetical protein
MWKTRTRNKFLAAGLIFIAGCICFVLYGWFQKLPDAPSMLTALTGGGGLWAIFNSFAIAWENRKPKEK